MRELTISSSSIYLFSAASAVFSYMSAKSRSLLRSCAGKAAFSAADESIAGSIPKRLHLRISSSHSSVKPCICAMREKAPSLFSFSVIVRRRSICLPCIERKVRLFPLSLRARRARLVNETTKVLMIPQPRTEESRFSLSKFALSETMNTERFPAASFSLIRSSMYSVLPTPARPIIIFTFAAICRLLHLIKRLYQTARFFAKREQKNRTALNTVPYSAIFGHSAGSAINSFI